MKKDIKQLWIDALNSGQYEQGRHRLAVDGKFCCLGVLCDLHAKQTGGKWENGLYLGHNKYLPGPVVSWAGFNQNELLSNESASTVKSGSVHFSDLNDEGVDFNRIAELIEEHL